MIRTAAVGGRAGPGRPGRGRARRDPDGELAGLYHQIARRHTSREPGGEVRLPADVRIMLMRAAVSEGLELSWLRPEAVRTVLGASASALLRGWANHERTAERAHWIGGQRVDDGIPAAALGPRPDVYPAPVRDLSAGLPGRGRTRRPYETEPVLAVLSAEADGPVDQLVLGMALERVLLTATRQGIRASFLNEALEYDDSRATIQQTTGKSGFANMGDPLQLQPARRDNSAAAGDGSRPRSGGPRSRDGSMYRRVQITAALIPAMAEARATPRCKRTLRVIRRSAGTRRTWMSARPRSYRPARVGGDLRPCRRGEALGMVEV